LPRYFFDTADGDSRLRDDEGVELAELGQARHEALTTLGEIARDELAAFDEREFTITVRNEAGKPVLRASLRLSVQRLA
jgi:hypothetical protein